ncbi:ATP-dependent zinc protease [Candidatus Saccharibacteria bacterium]|nr:ATP-dependent zinc protease [Candidatus Saccharibacteria bacterium]
MATKHDFHKVIIGRSELLSFIDYGIFNIPAKTDTGAYSSSVHASSISLDDKTLSFDLLMGHPACGELVQHIKTTKFRLVTVTNSFGHKKQRYEVILRVKLGPKVFKAKFTLADRSKNVYPMLLGRTLLNHRFLVDSSESSVNRIELKKKYGIEFPNDEEGERGL